MGAEPLLHAAVVNNARWCDAVCRSHGYPGKFGGRLWISAGHALPFYPNAITLSPDVTAAEATNGQGPWDRPGRTRSRTALPGSTWRPTG
jgi:hypothetical protein